MLTGNMRAQMFGGMPEYIRKLRAQGQPSYVPGQVQSEPMPEVGAMPAPMPAAMPAQRHSNAPPMGLMAKAAPQQAQEQPKFDMGLFNQSFDKPKMTWSDKIGIASGYLMDLDGSFGTGNADRFKAMYDERVDEQRSEFERKRQESIMLAAAQGDPTALAYLDPIGARNFKYNAGRDEKLDGRYEREWNREEGRYETEQERLARLEARGILESDRSYGLDARRTTAAEAAAAARGEPKETARYLSADELKAAGYPEGSVVQRKPDGTDDVRYKPNAEYSAGEISGFRNKANVLTEFQRVLGDYKNAVEQYGTIALYKPDNKEAGELNGLHQSLIFQAKDLLNLGILSKDDYENLNKLIPDATGMGTFGQGKDSFKAKLAPLEASITSQFNMIPEEYRKTTGQPAAVTPTVAANGVPTMLARPGATPARVGPSGQPVPEGFE